MFALFFLNRASKFAYTSNPEKFFLLLLQLIFQNRQVGAQPLQKQILTLNLRLKSVLWTLESWHAVHGLDQLLATVILIPQHYTEAALYN